MTAAREYNFFMDRRHLTETEELRRRNRELSILNQIAQSLNGEVNLAQALQTTLAQVADIFDLQTGWIWLLHPENGEPYLAAAQNLPPGLANYPRRMEGWCYCLETFWAGDLAGAANVNVVTCSRLKNLVDGTDGLRYHASIPLYAQGEKLGVLNVASPDWRELSPEDLRLLHIIGDLMSIAVARARLFERSIQLGAVEERNRLAREIHDTLAQGLTGIALKLEAADALIDAGGENAQIQTIIQQALGLTQASLEEARRSVLDLRAAPLEGRDLISALRELVVDQAHPGLEISLDLPKNLPPLSMRLEAGFYRMAQEALTNIIMHSQAQHARISLIAQVHALTLEIEDDGVGFDPQTAPVERFGLIGLSERAKLLGGKLTLNSAPNKGTRVLVTIPM
jgi:two-component system NarL family sensor kinase